MDTKVLVLLVILILGMIVLFRKTKEVFNEIDRIKNVYNISNEQLAEEFGFFSSIGDAITGAASTVAGGVKDVVGDLGDIAKKVVGKVEDVAEDAFKTVTKPITDAIKWIKKQLYEVIPFLIFQIGFIGLVMFWILVPDDISTAKQLFVYFLMFNMLVISLYITMVFWKLLGDGNEGLGAYLLRQEKNFFVGLWTALKTWFGLIWSALTKKKKEEFYCMESLCGVVV